MALRDSAAQVVDRLGLRVVADLQDTERMGKLDAAVTASGWRELRTESEEGGPWASAVEVAVVAEELGRGLADVPFIGPTMAADLRRLVGTTPTDTPETIVLTHDLSEAAHSRGGRLSEGGAGRGPRAARCRRWPWCQAGPAPLPPGERGLSPAPTTAPREAST